MIIQTQKKRVALRFGVSANVGGAKLRIRGRSAATGCLYFDRTVEPENWEETFDFLLPISPQKLIVDFDGHGAWPTTIETAYLPNSPEFTYQEQAIFNFLNLFLPNVCTKKPGIYNIPGTPYRFFYYEGDIIDEEDGPIITPARAYHYTNDIHASKKAFRQHSVPTNSVVILHEYTHLRSGDRDERQPDYNAVDLALSYGFPKSEVSYVFTKLIPETAEYQAEDQRAENYYRATEMSDYINQHPDIDVDF